MTKYLLECGYEHIQVCAGRDNGVDHLRYMGAQRAAREFAGKKQKVQFTALGMNYAKRKESYAWLIQQKKTEDCIVLPFRSLCSGSDQFFQQQRCEDSGGDWNCRI